MTKRMLIDATHHEETRVVVMEGNRLVEFDYESKVRRQLKGNIFLAKVTRVEPSLQAAFVNFGGNRHGFLPFSEIHPDYYRIPTADRDALKAEQEALEQAAAAAEANDEGDDDHAEDGGHNEGDDHGFAPAPETLEMDAEDTHAQGEAAQELVAEESGYVHDEIDLTPPDSHTDDAEDSDEDDEDDEEGDDDDDDAGEDAHDHDGDDEGEESEDLTAEGAAESGEEGQPADAAGAQSGDDQNGRRGGRRGWRRGRGGNGGNNNGGRSGGRRYMGARNGGRGRDEVSEDSVAALHARFRRKYKIQEVLKRGQIMLVQVSKEERGNKGAAVTTYLSLPGRYCVLMPNSPRGGGVSRKIGNFADRRRLKDMLSSLEIPSGMSVILRTAGVERSQPEIKRDFDYLTRLWDSIRELTLKSTAPAQIYEEGDLIKRSIRDIYSSSVDELLVSGQDGFEEARGFMNLLMPDHLDKIALYEDEKMPLFQRYQIESQINEIGEPVVQLKSGGYLVINQTEALVAVDVNSGRATKERHIEETALKTNLEAAEEVARQLRLRDLGGLVVIDFIDMEDRRNNAKVERRLKDALASDRARIQVSRISTFGLLELSRQRLNPSLTEAQFEKCPHCHGFGYIRSVDSASIAALRALEEEGVRARTNRVTLHVPNALAIYILNEKRDMLATIERRYGFNVMIHVDEALAPANYTVEAMKTYVEDEDGEEGIEGESSSAVEPSDDREVQPQKRAPRNMRRTSGRPATMSDSYEHSENARQHAADHNPAEDENSGEDAVGNVREAEPVDDDLDNRFNRSDVEPDGRGARRPSGPREGGGGERGGRSRGGRGGRNRGGRGGRDRNNGDRPSGDRAPRGPRPDNTPAGGGTEEQPRTEQPRREPREAREARPPREPRAPRNNPAQDNAPAPTTGDSAKLQPRYFVAKKRDGSAAPTAGSDAPSAPSAPRAPESSGGDEGGAKKRGWWSKFS